MNADDMVQLERVPMIWKHSLGVMPALVAGIHVFPAGFRLKDVDGRDKPGHDSELMVQYDREPL